MSRFDEFLDQMCAPPYPAEARTVLRDRCERGFDLAQAELGKVQRSFLHLPATSAHRKKLARTTRAPHMVTLAFYDCFIATSVYNDLPLACAELHRIRYKPLVRKIEPLLFTREL